ncbi:HNH endonuclease [Microbacterium sp. dk485]|uniref:HNH endonuclease signature motif containing protein n=1 Tax=Microbacterium sp. dk485 TaxID=2560021 RepID=UPI0010733ADD|nr:HNH endonuclease signature motif containing protein [Microbacterium sp. dk485]TFV82308.1 HNH endonuclease [Microbacterium sp. dk485]
MAALASIEDPDEDARLAAIVDELRDAEEEIAVLEAVKVAQLAGAMRIALRRMEGKHATQRAREMELRSIAAEIGAAVRWSDRVAQSRMSDALDLVERFPATIDALTTGRITARHAAVIQDAGCVLTDESDRAAFEQVVLEWAAAETVARTRDYARGLAEHLHPESITTRFERAEKARTVTLSELHDGLAKLEIIGPTTLLHGIHDRLTQQARAIRAATAHPDAVEAESELVPADSVVVDTRTLDQIRADLVCDMLLTGQPAIDHTTDILPGGLGAIRASVQVTVPALTAAGIADRGASIDGTSPIDADTARQLMGTAPGWDRILTHPITGMVLTVDRYRPGTILERFLAARDIHCRFPGCRQPARRCDHDHNLDWALGGRTTAGNLACLCKRHHTLKTETEWTAAQEPDGTIRWTSPLHRRYTDKAPPRVAFVPDADPPPF